MTAKERGPIHHPSTPVADPRALLCVTLPRRPHHANRARFRPRSIYDILQQDQGTAEISMKRQNLSKERHPIHQGRHGEAPGVDISRPFQICSHRGPTSAARPGGVRGMRLGLRPCGGSTAAGRDSMPERDPSPCATAKTDLAPIWGIPPSCARASDIGRQRGPTAGGAAAAWHAMREPSIRPGRGACAAGRGHAPPSLAEAVDGGAAWRSEETGRMGVARP